MVLDYAGFTQWLTDITHNPVFISLTSIFSMLGAILVVLSKTSIGRKALKTMQELSRNANAKIGEIHIKAVEMKEDITAFKKEIEEKEEALKQEVIQKSTIVYNQMDVFEDYMIQILSEFPNAKVQAKVTEFKNTWEKQKEKIKVVMGQTYSEIQEQCNKLQEQIDALKEEHK